MTSPIAASMVFSPCLPHDAALGNEGGDPYAFLIFDREDELAQLRGTCGAVVAQSPSGGGGVLGPSRSTLAQVDSLSVALNAP